MLEAQDKRVRYASWVREEMERRGWSQKDLSLASSVGQSMISNILRGMVIRPSAEQIIGLARAFEMDPTRVLEALGWWDQENNSS